MQQDVLFHLNTERWKMLSAIAQGTSTPKQLAKNTTLSLAYVSQQLKLMEAYGLLKQAKQATKRVGKPSTNYTINTSENVIITLRQGHASINTIKQNAYNRILNWTLNLTNDEERYLLQKFSYAYETLAENIDLLAITQRETDKIHLLAITTDVETFRTKHSNIKLGTPAGKEKTLVIWSHTQDEIITGLTAKESYFIDKIKNAEMLWEKKGASLAELKKRL